MTLASLRAKCYDSEPSYHDIVDALCGLNNIPVPERPPLIAEPVEAQAADVSHGSAAIPGNDGAALLSCGRREKSLSSVAGRAPGCGEEGER